MSAKDDIERLLKQRKSHVDAETKVRQKALEDRRGAQIQLLKDRKKFVANCGIQAVLEEINEDILERAGEVKRIEGIFTYLSESGEYRSDITEITCPVYGYTLSWNDGASGIFVGCSGSSKYPGLRIYGFLPRNESDAAELLNGIVGLSRQPSVIVDGVKDTHKNRGTSLDELHAEVRSAIYTVVIEHKDKGTLSF